MTRRRQYPPLSRPHRPVGAGRSIGVVTGNPILRTPTRTRSGRRRPHRSEKQARAPPAGALVSRCGFFPRPTAPNTKRIERGPQPAVISGLVQQELCAGCAAHNSRRCYMLTSRGRMTHVCWEAFTARSTRLACNKPRPDCRRHARNLFAVTSTIHCHQHSRKGPPPAADNRRRGRSEGASSFPVSCWMKG